MTEFSDILATDTRNALQRIKDDATMTTRMADIEALARTQDDELSPLDTQELHCAAKHHDALWIHGTDHSDPAALLDSHSKRAWVKRIRDESANRMLKFEAIP